MAEVYPNAVKKVAQMPGVRVAVRNERDELARLAGALFASHDNVGGHKITTRNGRVDAFVSFDGPAPLSMELGHFARQGHDGGIPNFVEGLHIFSHAIATAAL